MTRRRLESGRKALSRAISCDRTADECWPWTGPIGTHGYGTVHFGKKYYLAHRLMWQLLVGPIDPALVFDHTCHTEALRQGTCSGGVCFHRKCVNPSHLELVRSAENVMRGGSFSPENSLKTECPQGHPLDGIRTRQNGKTRRYCLTCHRARQAERRRGHTEQNHQKEGAHV